jgi:cobalt-zinc-cadmium resistance protein CzcA
MLDKTIQFSIKNKFIILLFTLVLIAFGSYSLKELPLDALPDITNNQVQIITTAPTLASQEIEQLITFPLEQAVKTVPKIIELRSISRFGLSVVTVVFEDAVDIYWAREQIFQRLKKAEENIPKYVGSPELAPITTGLGEIFQYDVYAKKGYEKQFDAIKLRTIQDWIILPQLQGVAGVAEISTWGGKLKQYEVSIDPNALNSLGVTITEIFDALEKNNQNTGGAYIEKDQYAYFIRGVGMATGSKDLEKVVVKNRNGSPVLVRDVASVKEGIALRYGASTKDGKGEIVSGMVLMLKGENSRVVVNRVKEKMKLINKTLPEGVVAEAFIDRGKLVDNAIGTVTKNLLEGALIVIFVLILFLGNLRAGLIVASVIPLAMLFAVILMNFFGVSGNLMSLGAIDFGIIVDGAVIIVEATMHHLQNIKTKKELSQTQMDNEVYTSASKIRNSAAFGEIIILIVYLPILALVGTEGKMFKPMAMTVGFAVIGAFVLSLTYVPMMSALFLSKKNEFKPNFSDKMMAWLEKMYTPFLSNALQFKKIVLTISLGLFLGALFIFKNMGGEFIPTIEEGDLAINATIMTGSSLSQMVETTTRYEKILKDKFPEIKTIVSKIGSGEIPTDPMPIESGDLIIVLKDKSEWTSADNWEELASLMKEEMEIIPGSTIEISQPIQMRFNELMTGSRSDIAIKIFGDNLETLDLKAKELISKINTIEGIGDLKAEKVSGLPQITIKYDYNKIALYGLNINDINKIIRSSFAGEVAGKIYEESKRFDVVVRMKSVNRTDITDVSNLFIPLPNGDQVPLSQVASVEYEQGPVQVTRENGKRRITVGLNVRGRDVKSVVEEIQQKLDTNFKLPTGYYITYGGQFENLVEANKRLSIALPIALGLILVLLFFTFNSVKQAGLIFTAIPLSAIGGVFALLFRGMPFSISAGIGFIALFGIAVLNGIVLISYFNQLKKEGVSDPLERVLIGTKTRLRPVLMTAAVAALGFLPMALSNSGGAEVQKPLATVVIGGLFSATLLTLIVLPILYLLSERVIKRKKIRTTKPFVTLFLFLVSFVSFAQKSESISLDKAIEMAKINNRDLKIATKEIEKQSVLIKTAFQADPLQIQYQGGQFNSNAYDHNLSVQQYFPMGKITTANRELQKNLVQLAEKRKALSEYEIEKAVTLSYYQYLYGVSIQKLNNELNVIYTKFLNNAQLRFKTGESGSIEVISAKAKVNEIEMLKKQLELDLAIYQQQLQFFVQTNENIAPEANTPIQFVGSTSLYSSKIIGLTDDYYNQQVVVFQKEAAISQAQKTPKFGLGYFAQTIDKKSYFQGFTAGLQIPVFGGFNTVKARAAEISILQAQLEQEKNKFSIELQIRQLQNEFKKQQNAIAYFQNEGLLYAEQIITTAQKSYANGDMSYWNYISFLNQAIDIKKQYAETLYLFNQSSIQLQFPSLLKN